MQLAVGLRADGRAAGIGRDFGGSTGLMRFVDVEGRAQRRGLVGLRRAVNVRRWGPDRVPFGHRVLFGSYSAPNGTRCQNGTRSWSLAGRWVGRGQLGAGAVRRR